MENVGTVVAVLGGIQAVLTGLVAWLGKVWLGRALAKDKARLDADLESLRSQLAATNQRLQATLDQHLHVQRLLFEKEFASLQAIWATLVVLRDTAMGLRPALDLHDPAESLDQRKTRRLKAYYDAHQVFAKAVEQNRPFFAEGIYQELVTLHRLLHSEAIEYQHHDPKETFAGYWERAAKNRERVITSIEAICTAIRQRLLPATLGTK